MQPIVSQIATILNLNPQNDVYILAFFLLMWLIMWFLWAAKIYESMFWLVLWISIFIVLQVLLWYSGNDGYVLPFLNEWISRFIIWSSVYLIVILPVLVPINWWFSFSGTKNPLAKIFITIFLVVLFILFFFSVFIWLIEKIYIFKIESAFSLLKKWDMFNNFISWSKIYLFITSYLHIVIVFWVFFIIYKLLFADIINSMVVWLLSSLFKKKWGWGGGWHDDWGHGHH